jgi:3-oxocholest-4-en-26-oyl-CoA dehydrogenase beta subunit
MDFSFTEEQVALRELARQILSDHLTHERLKAVEGEPDWFDRKVWAELAKSNLLGVAVSEDVGGSGLGLLELGALLEEIGRAVAPIPVWPTLVLGALPIDRFGNAEQRKRFLPAVCTGEAILTAALVETGWDEPTAIATTARRDGGHWRLDGSKTCVPAAHLAARVLVPARTGDGELGIFLLDPSGPGVTRTRQVCTNGEPQFHLALAGAKVAAEDVLGTPDKGASIFDWILQHATAGLCAMQIGVTDRALRMTAEYTSNRKQFGKAIATFQAVGQRAADAYIDVEAVRWTAWQALWRLGQGDNADLDVAVAKFWACDSGHRVTYAAQHLHGGIGLDMDYPLHRYYLWSKQIELSLGSAPQQLLKIGALMA